MVVAALGGEQALLVDGDPQVAVAYEVEVGEAGDDEGEGRGVLAGGAGGGQDGGQRGGRRLQPGAGL
ncbi:hypothetical protein ACFQ2M_06845 [Kitasatospora saccharophila]|uniref:hypothetical protein n=1 Tax=Kitasatospora saccharophila TaxID=407973 RepID=UPI0031DA3E6D